jgi:pimeloyl-ACP methyl ester carboxylesterase
MLSLRNLGKVHLLGTSRGGSIVLTVASLYPEVIRTINSLIIVKTLLYKIPPNLPLPKGVPRYAGFEKEGRGEIF